MHRLSATSILLVGAKALAANWREVARWKYVMPGLCTAVLLGYDDPAAGEDRSKTRSRARSSPNRASRFGSASESLAAREAGGRPAGGERACDQQRPPRRAFA